MFKTRLISGIVLVIIALATIIPEAGSYFYTSGCFTDRNERALQGNEGKR